MWTLLLKGGDIWHLHLCHSKGISIQRSTKQNDGQELPWICPQSNPQASSCHKTFRLTWSLITRFWDALFPSIYRGPCLNWNWSSLGILAYIFMSKGLFHCCTYEVLGLWQHGWWIPNGWIGTHSCGEVCWGAVHGSNMHKCSWLERNKIRPGHSYLFCMV